MLVTGSQTGTYTVNCDGTGVVTQTLTLSDGSTQTQANDFISTGAMLVPNPLGPFFPGQLVATAAEDAARIPSPIVPGGLFVTHRYSRLPDQPTQ